MGWAKIYVHMYGIPTSESIKVKRLNWIFVSQGTRRCGRQIQLQLQLRLRLQAKATASVWILWLNYQRMMFWWFHLHISAIRQEQEEEQEKHEEGGEQQQQGWRHCVNIVPQPKFMYNTCPTSRRVHKDAETQMEEMETKPESNSLPACRWEVSILIEAINTLNEFPAVSSSMERMEGMHTAHSIGLARCPALRGIFAPIARCRLRLSTLRLLGLSPGLDQGAGLARSPVPFPNPSSRTRALLCLLCYAYFQQTIPIRAAIVVVVVAVVVQSVIKVL